MPMDVIMSLCALYHSIYKYIKLNDTNKYKSTETLTITFNAIPFTEIYII